MLEMFSVLIIISTYLSSVSWRFLLLHLVPVWCLLPVVWLHQYFRHQSVCSLQCLPTNQGHQPLLLSSRFILTGYYLVICWSSMKSICKDISIISNQIYFSFVATSQCNVVAWYRHSWCCRSCTAVLCTLLYWSSVLLCTLYHVGLWNRKRETIIVWFSRDKVTLRSVLWLYWDRCTSTPESRNW